MRRKELKEIMTTRMREDDAGRNGHEGCGGYVGHEGHEGRERPERQERHPRPAVKRQNTQKNRRDRKVTPILVPRRRPFPNRQSGAQRHRRI